VGRSVAERRLQVTSVIRAIADSRIPSRVWSSIAIVCLALLIMGCDPITERRYFNEGAGVDLYTADRAAQIELLNAYVDFICAQPGNCIDNTTFVLAGMNDIDLRCDGFLTWLDARRRDKEPILAELSAINTAVHSIMTVTGSTPTALNIVTTAFGLASATYTNWNSRLLISVNQSTVQEVVYKSQQDFREKIKSYSVPDRPTAIYLLRNYLRLCMPITIEAQINTTTTLVQRPNVPLSAAKTSLVVATTTPPHATVVRTQFIADDPGNALIKFVYPNGIAAGSNKANEKMVTDFMAEKKITDSLALFLRSSLYTTERAELFQRLRQRGLIN